MTSRTWDEWCQTQSGRGITPILVRNLGQALQCTLITYIKEPFPMRLYGIMPNFYCCYIDRGLALPIYTMQTIYKPACQPSTKPSSADAVRSSAVKNYEWYVFNNRWIAGAQCYLVSLCLFLLHLWRRPHWCRIVRPSLPGNGPSFRLSSNQHKPPLEYCEDQMAENSPSANRTKKNAITHMRINSMYRPYPVALSIGGETWATRKLDIQSEAVHRAFPFACTKRGTHIG